jgi:hypothetical protein
MIGAADRSRASGLRRARAHAAVDERELALE